MTTTTFTDDDIPFNRFDQPLLGVASDAVHLVFYWPATSLGFVDKDWWEKHTEDFKRKMLEKQRGLCTWCEAPLDYNDITVDHVWPVSKGGRNWTLNYQVLHWWCGIAKSDSIGWVLMRDLLVLRTLLDGHRQPGITIPPIPNKQWFVVGAALVVGGCLTVKWLREDVDGVPRYEHVLRSAQDSLTRTATTVSRHLESAGAQALQVQSTACGFAQRARGIAGGVPTCAVHLAERARGLPSASATKAANHAARTVRGATGVVRRAASGAVNSVPHTPGLAQRAAGRMSDALPRPWRKTRTALAVSTFGAASRVPVLHS